MKKNNNNINNNNIKEIESEYEFKLGKEKFYKPLNKYENVFNFDKINLFKSWISIFNFLINVFK